MTNTERTEGNGIASGLPQAETLFIIVGATIGTVSPFVGFWLGAAVPATAIGLITAVVYTGIGTAGTSNFSTFHKGIESLLTIATYVAAALFSLVITSSLRTLILKKPKTESVRAITEGAFVFTTFLIFALLLYSLCTTALLSVDNGEGDSGSDTENNRQDRSGSHKSSFKMLGRLVSSLGQGVFERVASVLFGATLTGILGNRNFHHYIVDDAFYLVVNNSWWICLVFVILVLLRWSKGNWCSLYRKL